DPRHVAQRGGQLPIDLGWPVGPRPGRAARGVAAIIEAGEELPPFRPDRRRVLRVFRIEPLDPGGIRALQEPGLQQRFVQFTAASAGHRSYPFSTSLSVVPNRAGLSATTMPADFIASILSSAPPLPPEMMAPAWPMRRPVGAVRPAMKPTTGFFRFSRRRNSAASSSALPPISPIITIDSVAGSARNISRQSMKLVQIGRASCREREVM